MAPDMTPLPDGSFPCFGEVKYEKRQRNFIKVMPASTRKERRAYELSMKKQGYYKMAKFNPNL